jgi:hypothetical protein
LLQLVNRGKVPKIHERIASVVRAGSLALVVPGPSGRSVQLQALPGTLHEFV